MFAVPNNTNTGINIFDSKGEPIEEIFTSIDGTLDCSNLSLTQLIVPSKGIRKLNCSRNYLNELVIDNKELEELNCSNNKLNKLILPDGIIRVVNCSRNDLVDLYIPDSVIQIDCSWNKLTKIIVPKIIKNLNCIINNLSDVNKDEISEFFIPSLLDLCINLVTKCNLKFTSEVVSNSLPSDLVRKLSIVKKDKCKKCKEVVSLGVVREYHESREHFYLRKFVCYKHKVGF